MAIPRFINPNVHSVSIPNHARGHGFVTIEPHDTPEHLRKPDGIYFVEGEKFREYVQYGQLLPFRPKLLVETAPEKTDDEAGKETDPATTPGEGTDPNDGEGNTDAATDPDLVPGADPVPAVASTGKVPEGAAKPAPKPAPKASPKVRP